MGVATEIDLITKTPALHRVVPVVVVAAEIR